MKSDDEDMSNRDILLMLVIFFILTVGYFEITEQPRTLEEDKRWITIQNNY